MMNQIGIYFAYWEREWQADFARYVRKVKQLGFDVLELAAGALPEMSADQRRALAALAREAERIVKEARERQSQLVSEQEITKQAERGADDIIEDARARER